MRVTRLIVLSLAVISCGVEGPETGARLGTKQGPLTAYCTATVTGKGVKDVETDYLPRVIRCENGSAPLEALKAQAVAARSYLYYKLNTSGQVADGTSDQVYTCSAQPTAIHYQAVNETAGQVLRYSNTQVAAFYVAGSVPSNATSCVAKAGDNDYSNTEKYVTYNWGLSAGALHQTSLGWINAGNYANRGCKSQNGASCLAKAGWGYQDIVKFYYGMDIQLVTAQGSCVQSCACSPGASESQACGVCGKSTRTCGADCQWGGWSGCGGQGVCSPGQSEAGACGQCGQRTRTCNSGCGWDGWSACSGEGACAPGATDTEACGKCGTRTRACSASCGWDGWSGCGGEGQCAPGAIAQSACGECGVATKTCGTTCVWGESAACASVSPDSAITCDTTAAGACGPGLLACLGTEVSCVATGGSSPESCNGIDDDCNGKVDDGATTMADPPPALAASVVGSNVPPSLAQGTTETASISFRNDGALAWEAGSLHLMAEGPVPGSSSPLFDASWQSAFMVASNTALVPPGDPVTISFTVRGGAVGTSGSRFWLTHDTGTIRCPDASLTVGSVVEPPDDGGPDADAGGQPGGDTSGGDDVSGSGDPADGTSGSADASPAGSGDTLTVVPGQNVFDSGSSGCSATDRTGGPVAELASVLLVLLGLGYRRSRCKADGRPS
jgi:hypothetical protein